MSKLSTQVKFYVNGACIADNLSSAWNKDNHVSFEGSEVGIYAMVDASQDKVRITAAGIGREPYTAMAQQLYVPVL